MRKSNALMLSYMIFLTLAILAQLIFKWDGLDRISIAATIAGCFFALADLSNWYISYRTPLIEAIKKDFDNISFFGEVAENAVGSQQKELAESISLLAPYKDNYPGANKLISIAEEKIIENKNREKAIAEANIECNKAQSILNNKLDNLNRIQIVEIGLVTVGFVVFFAIIAFDWILTLLSPFQSIATVLAFIIIMLNYYLRDLLEEKSKREVDEILANVQKEKEDIIKTADEFKRTPILDGIKDYIEIIEKAKKERHNGQTENAQP